MARIDVKKTYKLYIGGAFPRSESGRTYLVNDAKGALMANASQASRKDARDAVVAARKAFPDWSAATAYNRGQVVYRIAEVAMKLVNSSGNVPGRPGWGGASSCGGCAGGV